jgi:hypothetical protein
MKTALDMLKFLEADLGDYLNEKITDELRVSYLSYVRRIIETIKKENEEKKIFK